MEPAIRSKSCFVHRRRHGGNRWQSAEVMQTFKACSQNECRCTQYDTINRFKTTHLMFFTQVELHMRVYSVDMCGWMSASLHIETQLGEDSLHPAENRKQKTYIYIYMDVSYWLPNTWTIADVWLLACVVLFVCICLGRFINMTLWLIAQWYYIAFRGSPHMYREYVINKCSNVHVHVYGYVDVYVYVYACGYGYGHG